MSISKYTRQIHPSIASIKQSGKGTALIVSGNESADLDSCASSVITAYLYNNESHKFDSIVPLINIPREDFSARPDVEYLFKKLGISKEHLFFQEDLYELAKNTSASLSLKAFLVDHNRLVGDHQQLFTDSDVVGIIDHHVDENLYLDADPRVIEKSGSCSSLIVRHFKNRVAAQLFDIDVLQLALAPVLLDTSNMNHKVERADVDSMKFIQSRMTPGNKIDTLSFFTTLEHEKKNLDVLSVGQIMKKDYKQWDGTLRLGISSVPKSLEYLLQRDDSFAETMAQFSTERQLDVYAIMTSYVDQDSKFHRELAIYGATDNAQVGVEKFIADCTESLRLKPTSHASLRTFEQGDKDASRKQVAPLLRESLQGAKVYNL